MTIKNIKTHDKRKLSNYLCLHLKNKKRSKGKDKRYLEFTYEEGRDALMSALKVSHSKKDIKLFLQQLLKASDEL